MEFFYDDAFAMADLGIPSLKRPYPFAEEDQSNPYAPAPLIPVDFQDWDEMWNTEDNYNTCFGRVKYDFLDALLDETNAYIDYQR